MLIEILKSTFDSWKSPDGWVKRLNKALTSRYGGLKGIDNIFWLDEEGWNDFFDYKEMLDSFINNQKMIILYPYSLDMCDATEIIDAVSRHQISLIKKKGKWEKKENFGRERA